jgi:vancomycin resistance protein YoaR
MNNAPSYPNRPAYAPARPGINPWLIRLPILLITGGILLVIVLVLFLVAFQMRNTERMFPGVHVYGVDVSGMTQDEVRLALAGRFDDYASQAVYTFRDGDQIWQMTAADLGVAFDLEGTVQEAYAVGHQSDAVTDMLEQANSWFVGYSIAPRITYDESVAAAQLTAMAAEINRPAVNATLTMNGAQVITTDGETGRALDVSATLGQLREAMLRFQSGVEIPLIINETPPLVWNVEEPAGKIRAALSAPITLTATDVNGQLLGPWVATVDQIAALLRVERVDNGDGTQGYNVSVNTQAFEAYLNSLAPGLVLTPRDARFDFNEATGQLEVIQPGVSGRALNVPETLKQIELAVFATDNRTVPMVFDYTLSRYHNQTSAAELGIKEIVAEATTYYAGSGENRRRNIALAASKFQGLIIAPGEEFSFNYYLGEIGPETGFLEDKVIFGGRTTLGYGGGACQVSTTLFRAAFTGGFAITERNSHGYRVGYYEQQGFPPGLDAAIWQPERDFRFQNNTPYHLLIEVSVMPTENALQFRYYSTKHWNAEIEEAIIKNVSPPNPTVYEANPDLKPGEILQVDYSADGAEVTVYRNVYDMAGNLAVEDYEYTNYLPWGAIFQVAPGDSRLNS